MEQWEITKLRLIQKRLYEVWQVKEREAREAEDKWRTAQFTYLDAAGLCRCCLKPLNEGDHGWNTPGHIVIGASAQGNDLTCK